MNLHIKVAFKLFHQDQVAPAGTVGATAESIIQGNRLWLDQPHNCGFHVVVGTYKPIPDNPVPEWLQPSAIRPTVRRHAEVFLKDTRFPILYDPESGIESAITVL
jgi:hypothetical protein